MSRPNHLATLKNAPLEHEFNADATAISGQFHLPLVETIEPQATVQLHKKGGYRSQHEGQYRVEGVLSYQKAYTQVAGNDGEIQNALARYQPDEESDFEIQKKNAGWQTLSTVVVEGLNIMEIVTVDRIVGQIMIEHPKGGGVPTVSFLGSRFENFRIAGIKVDVKVNPYILEKSAHQGFTRYTTHPSAAELEALHARRHSGLVSAAKSNLFELRNDLYEEYDALLARLKDNHSLRTGGAGNADKETVECSLVEESAEEKATLGPSGSGIQSPVVSDHAIFHQFGHLIKIRDFGVLELAKVKIEHKEFDKGIPALTEVWLTMLDMRLGCAISGDTSTGSTHANGK